LKPANIMIDTKKEPVVMDFGLARQMDIESRLTQSGMAVGTPAYMSPEQIRGDSDDVGATADIYALGVILYELLTGQLPFRGPIAKVVYNIVHEDPVAPSQIREGIDPELEAICAKLMAKDRAERFQSMDDVAAALKELLREKKKVVNRPVSAPKPSSTLADSNVGRMTETGALNAFFAAQASDDPTHTVVERSTPQKPMPVIRSRTKQAVGRGQRNVKLIGGGLVGLLLLCGVIIHFNGGKVELDDDTDAIVNVEKDGSIHIRPQRAATKQATEPSLGEQDPWESLIDRDLSKWVKYSGGGPIAGEWSVSPDNVLKVARATGGDIRTTKQYQDFELEFEWSIGVNGNSGVLYRVAPGHAEPWNIGPEYQLLDDLNFKGKLSPEQKTGSIYGLFGPQRAVSKPIGQWNQSRVVARGNHLEHWLNGTRIAQADIGSDAWNVALRSVRRLADFPDFAMSPAGYVVLQALKNDVSYRNIRIRAKAATETKQATGDSTASRPPAIRNDSFHDLFNGRDLSGWQGMERIWSWENGQLVGSTNRNGRPLDVNTALCSERRYKDFELTFDVKLETPLQPGKDVKLVPNSGIPNSGIQFRSTILDVTTYKVAGPQADIGGKFWGGLYGEATVGMMHRADPALVRSIVRENDWNQYRLLVQGDRVAIEINDVETLNQRFPDLPQEGVIGFQLHRGLVMTAKFRKIRIREIGPPESPDSITIHTTSGASSMAASPDGRYFATASQGVPGSITLRETESGALVKQITRPGEPDFAPDQLAYSPDGKWILYSSGFTCRMVNVDTGRERAEQTFSARPSIVLFPRSSLAMALFHEREVHRTKRDEVPQRLRFWNWETNEVLLEKVLPIVQQIPLWAPAISPDGRFATFAWGHYFVRYGLSRSAEAVSLGTRNTFEKAIRVRSPLVFSADGKYAAGSVKSADCMGMFFEVASGRIIHRLDPQTAEASNQGHEYGCNLAVTSDGRGIVSADHNGRVALWTFPSGELVTELGQFHAEGKHHPPQLVVTRDDRVIIAGDDSDSRITIQTLPRVPTHPEFR
jgi:WD40 repeat protein